MKLALCSVAMNEQDIIGAHIKNWQGLVDKHLILVSKTSWEGSETQTDRTVEIARGMGCEVIEDTWKNEAEQRTFGLRVLEDYDFVLIVDPDEFYTKADQKKLIDRLQKPIDYLNRDTRKQPVFVTKNMVTYWKTLDYVFDPPDSHKPIIAVDPKRAYFIDKREVANIGIDSPSINNRQVVDITIHHLSWVKTDAKVKEKINSYSHKNDIQDTWFNEVWSKWTPGSDMKIRPYGREPSIAKHQPAPEEIRRLLDTQNMV